MKIDIAQAIEQLLYQHDSIVIPGLGIFTSKPSNAVIDYLGETISPPSKVLAFDETVQVDDGLLVQYLTQNQRYGQDEARAMIESFVSKTNELLDNREIVTLPGVGRLYKNYARKVQFLPETTNFRADAFGLPTLSAATKQVQQAAQGTPVAIGSPSRIQVKAVDTLNAASPSDPDTAPSEEPSEIYTRRRFGTSFWLTLAALFLSASVGLGFWLKKQKAKMPTLPVEMQDAPPNINPITATIEQAIEATEQAKAKQEAHKPSIASPHDDIHDDVSAASAAQSAQLAHAAKPSPKNSKIENKSAKTRSGRRCVLVLGAFEDRSNADNLIAKLKANNYDTYHRRDENGRHQVGVEFVYKDYFEVRSKIEDLQALTGLKSIWIKKK